MAKTKGKAVNDGVASLNKLYGAGTVYVFGKKKAVPTKRISTGSLTADEVMGGGIPMGRITELWGPPGGGKTTLCLHTIVEAQKTGIDCGFVDVEYSFDPDYAAKLGVNVNELVFSQPDYGEQGLQIVETLIKESGLGLVIVDSIAALVPKAEYEGEIGDSGVGLLARMMAQGVRKLANTVRHAGAALVFINQIRHVIGSNYPMREPPGGEAMKHYASIRAEVNRVAALKDGDNIIGNRTKIKSFKNKLVAPYRSGEFDLIFGLGVSREAEVIDYAVKLGILRKDGAKYAFGNYIKGKDGEKFAHGREAAKDRLVEDRELFGGMWNQIREKIFAVAVEEPEEES